MIATVEIYGFDNAAINTCEIRTLSLVYHFVDGGVEAPLLRKLLAL